MKRRVLVSVAMLFLGICLDSTQAQCIITPMDIQFRRQAVQRLVFDKESAIPLSILKPGKVVRLEVEYPLIEVSGEATSYEVDKGLLTVSAEETSESALWIGGFNPFGTYNISFDGNENNSGEAGVDKQNNIKE